MPTPPTDQIRQRIPNPRRLLILSPSSHSSATIPPFLHALTGTPVLEPPSGNATESAPSFAGYTTHPPLQIRNRYYAAEVPVWVDEIALQGDGAWALGEGGEKTQTAQSTTPSGAGSGPTAQPEPEPITTPSLWKSEFSGPEAQVVRDAVGAVVMCILNPSPSNSSASETQTQTQTQTAEKETQPLKDFLRAIGDVRALIEEERGGMGDVPGLMVLVGSHDKPSTQAQAQASTQGTAVGDLDADLSADVDLDAEEPFSVPWWEDQLYEMGLLGMEVVSWDPKAKGVDEEARNQFGEYQGMRRIREVLETHDWAPSSLSDDEDETKGDSEADEIEKMLLGAEEDDTGFGLEVNELEREMVGLRFAIGRGGGSGREEDSEDEGDEELRVDAVEALMLRMAAIRDMSDDLPEHERKRFAAKAVRDIMKEI